MHIIQPDRTVRRTLFPRARAPLLALGALLWVTLTVTALADTPLRIMAANLTSGSAQKYEGPGIRILQGLDADVVLLQEFNYGSNSTTELEAFVRTSMGDGATYFREAGASIPNGILSRYPILEAGEWDDTSVSDRDFVWARIDIPGDRDLWAISVHLLSKGASYRNTEAKQLVGYIQRKGIPADAFLVIGGDFNTESRTESCMTTLSQVVSTAGPYPVDQKNDGDTNQNRNKPYDAVLADADLGAKQTPVAIGQNRFTNGLVLDSRNYTPLSDVYPVQSGDSGTTNMQHMGVVKDYLMPDPGTGEDPPGEIADLLITEIMYAPSSGGGPEWIELYNPGSQAIDLSGLLLTDNEGIDLNEGEFWFTGGTVIDAGGYLVVGASTTAYIDLVWSGIALANGGDQVMVVVDAEHDGLFLEADVQEGLTYASIWGGNGNGYSLSRTCLDCEASQASSWTASLTLGGTPGSENDTL